jgi:hypothetical protein
LDFIGVAAVLSVSLVYASAALAQERLSDKDLEQRIRSPVSTTLSPRATFAKPARKKMPRSSPTTSPSPLKPYTIT